MKVSDISSKTIEFFKKHGKKIACTSVVAGMIGVPVDEAIAEEHDETVFRNPTTNKAQVIENKDSLAMMSEEEFDEHVLQQAHKGGINNKQSTGLEMQTDLVSISIGDKTVSFEVDINNTDGLIEQIKQFIDEQITEEMVENVNNLDVQSPLFIINGAWEKTNNYNDKNGYKKENREYKRTVLKVTPKLSYDSDYFNNDYKKILDFIMNNANANEIFEVVDTSDETMVVTSEEETDINTTNYTMQIDGTDIQVSILTRKESKRQILLIVARLGGILALGLIAGYVLTDGFKHP